MLGAPEGCFDTEGLLDVEGRFEGTNEFVAGRQMEAVGPRSLSREDVHGDILDGGVVCVIE